MSLEMTDAVRKEERINILVIDDEPGIRDLLSYDLGLKGYNTVTACDGKDAIEKIKHEKFHLLICDIKMPKMDGIQTLEEVKRFDPDIRVIIITGYATIENAVLSMKTGAHDFLQKPFDMDQLQSLIDKSLEDPEIKDVAALYEASKAIFSVLKIEVLLPILADLSRKLLKADDVSVLLMGEDKKLFVAASNGLDNAVARNVRLALGDGVAGKVAEWKETTIIIGSLDHDPRFHGIISKEEIKSSILCPLMSQTEILGVLCAARTNNEIPFNNSDMRYANIFASQISQAIDNARLYRELENKLIALNESYARLSETQDELIQSEKLTAIGELASGVAHEVNSPLTTVMGLVDLMLLESDDGLSKEKIEDLKTVKKEAERCRKITQNLLQFVRKQKSVKEPAQMNELIEKTLELLQFDLRNSGIRIRKEFDHAIPPIEVDPMRIEQVFLNIINNARHALAGCSQPELIIRTHKLDKCVRVYFIDNGCGIPQDNMSKIFDPFFTTKETGKGTGLGLSISYGIIKEHKGKIHVESNDGEGTQFCIELPLAFTNP